MAEERRYAAPQPKDMSRRLDAEASGSVSVRVTNDPWPTVDVSANGTKTRQRPWFEPLPWKLLLHSLKQVQQSPAEGVVLEDKRPTAIAHGCTRGQMSGGPLHVGFGFVHVANQSRVRLP